VGLQHQRVWHRRDEVPLLRPYLSIPSLPTPVAIPWLPLACTLSPATCHPVAVRRLPRSSVPLVHTSGLSPGPLPPPYSSVCAVLLAATRQRAAQSDELDLTETTHCNCGVTAKPGPRGLPNCNSSEYECPPTTPPSPAATISTRVPHTFTGSLVREHVLIIRHRI